MKNAIPKWLLKGFSAIQIAFIGSLSHIGVGAIIVLVVHGISVGFFSENKQHKSKVRTQHNE